jgi:hypothetical protein
MRGALLNLSSYCLRAGLYKVLRQTFNSVIKLGFHSLFGELEGIFIHGVRMSNKIRGVLLPKGQRHDGQCPLGKASNLSEQLLLLVREPIHHEVILTSLLDRSQGLNDFRSFMRLSRLIQV